MNTWSQEEQQELHESLVYRLYKCKPVKMCRLSSKIMSKIKQQSPHEIRDSSNGIYFAWIKNTSETQKGRLHGFLPGRWEVAS